MTTEVTTPNSGEITGCDHQAQLDTFAKQLDHIDDMCHRISQLVDQLEPHLPRLVKLLAVRNPFTKGKTSE